MDEVREKLCAICREDGNRTRDIMARALPPPEVEAAVDLVLGHIRAIPDALAFVRQRAQEWQAPGLTSHLFAYLAEPVETLPERLYGAYGYLDDAYLAVGAAICLDDPAQPLGGWGSLDPAATQTLRACQGRIRALLHPDVAAFQDAMLVMFRTCAEEARRQAAARCEVVYSAGVGQRAGGAELAADEARWTNGWWRSLPGVYASLG